MVLAVKRGAGRVVVDRVIIGKAVAPDVSAAVKLSAAEQATNSMRFVFIDN